MAKCKCGNYRFYAHQECSHDVTVDGDNDFIEDNGIYELGKPFGPYVCTKCHTKYGYLDELPEE